MKILGKPEKLATKLFKLDQDKIYQITEYKDKRSLNANAYMWKLINEIANVLSLSKEDVYLNMLKSYGQILLIPLEKGKSPTGFFRYYEYYCKSKINEKEVDYYKVFKGSSEMDTYEMSKLIDGIVQECTNLGIPTLKED